MSQLIQRTSGLGLVALATLPLLALASSAWAGEARVKVGDLSQAAQAAAFNQSLLAAQKQLCSHFPLDVHYRSNIKACTDSVRDEAMSQLTPTQRDQLAAYDDGHVRLAGAAPSPGADR